MLTGKSNILFAVKDETTAIDLCFVVVADFDKKTMQIKYVEDNSATTRVYTTDGEKGLKNYVSIHYNIAVDKYAVLKQEIVEIFNQHKGRYGYRRILAILKSKGYTINHKTVQKLMNNLNLKGKQRKNGKYHSYKGEVGKVAGNILKRDFNENQIIIASIYDYSFSKVNTIELIEQLLDQMVVVDNAD